MTEQILSYLITGIGLIGFWLAGKKIWWCWWVNVANQILWTVFAVVTGYYAFLIGTAFYFVVFTKNAIQWTRDHFREDEKTQRLLPKVTFTLDAEQMKNELRKAEDGVATLQEKLPEPDIYNEPLVFMTLDEVRRSQHVFIGNDGHVCHASKTAEHIHAVACPTGAHPMGWQHQPGEHKTCTICR